MYVQDTYPCIFNLNYLFTMIKIWFILQINYCIIWQSSRFQNVFSFRPILLTEVWWFVPTMVLEWASLWHILHLSPQVYPIPIMQLNQWADKWLVNHINISNCRCPRLAPCYLNLLIWSLSQLLISLLPILQT